MAETGWRQYKEKMWDAESLDSASKLLGEMSVDTTTTESERVRAMHAQEYLDNQLDILENAFDTTEEFETWLRGRAIANGLGSQSTS